MNNTDHKNDIYDISFFNIDEERSCITFNENQDIKFNIIQNKHEEKSLSYKHTLNIENDELLQYHQIEILNKKKISLFFNIIKEEVMLKEMSYVKRIKKNNTDNKIYVLLCAKKLITDMNQIKNELTKKKLLENEDYKFVKDGLALIPKVSPATKEICEIWSKQYWPLNWKGNSHENQLKQIYLNEFQLPKLDKFFDLFKILNNYQSDPKEKQISTLFYNFKNGKVFVFNDTTISTKFPIAHSVINGVDEICSLKENSDNEYLLQDYYVITTHEPCQMCSMALIHSRIKLLLFDKKTTNGRLTNDDFCLADFDKLNWKYQVLQYNFMK